MTEKQWQIFCDFKKTFLKKVEEWSSLIPELGDLQKQAAIAAKTPDYPFETPVVYNRDFDKLTKEDEIKLIVIGDNPGKDEQLAKNNRYLVGQAGKIADGFFRRNPELGVDFRKNVIIVNKTPVHSAKTAQLKKIMALGGKKVSDLIMESQLWMAKETAKLHKDLCEAAGEKGIKPELWLVGYAELKNKGFFTGYRDELKNSYGTSEYWDKVFVFQHFSMNRFTIDLGKYIEENKLEAVKLIEVIHKLGTVHKTEIYN